MKFSESWLREWVNPQIDTEELVAQLTMAGLEVDAVESVAGEFSGVIVGEIVEVSAHPDAEKLRVCQVVGHQDGPMQVVCGAANARTGIKVPFATIGAKLPGDFKIKKAKLRGVESFGMLCAQTELQAGDDDTGLWELPADAPVGADIRTYLVLDDKAIEVDLTPNRGDCLSIRGLAREVGVLNSCDVNAVAIADTPAVHEDAWDVVIENTAACPAYVGRVIKNVDVSVPTPNWMVERLRRSGVRSIDPVVDITNYVLLELGQPMHAFNLGALKGAIVVRDAAQGEQLHLLDDQTVTLKAGTLVIADDSGPIALAGIMGGKSTAVDSNTQSIFLESAFFEPAELAGKARAYGLHTDSSHRFERGVDSQLQAAAVERATQLLLEITGGEPGPLVVKKAADQGASTITLRKARLTQALGMALEAAVVKNMIERLGLPCMEESAEHWVYEVPSYRFDLAIEEDLIEEVARIYGYDRLPVCNAQFEISLPVLGEQQPQLPSLNSHLVSRGLQEVVTYSFVDPEVQAHFSANITPVALKNPISSEMSVMRTSLLPGLMGVIKTNLSRQKSRVSIFETGLRFESKDGSTQSLSQQRWVAGAFYGALNDSGWSNDTPREFDFYDVKGEVETLMAVFGAGRECRFEPVSDISYLHPGRAARVFLCDQAVGYLGAVHPVVLKALGLGKTVWCFELNLEVLMARALPAFAPLSKFPEVNRDLAIVVPENVAFSDLELALKSSAGEWLTNLKLFDVYRGEGVDTERKSLAFSLTFQHPSRTLNDEEINASVASVVSRLEEDFSAILR